MAYAIHSDACKMVRISFFYATLRIHRTTDIMNNRPLLTAFTVFLPTFATFCYADHAEQAEFFEEVTILGNQERLEAVTGSAHLLSDDDLEIFEYADIQRILRTVPGVSVQVEDGYGLRPNIGIRGVPTERSARVVLLEDNVLVAPAPYSASSAYYFPTMGRMYNVEVVKGPSAITQGPNTVGGAVNFVSTPIPKATEGKVNLEVGSDSTTRSHVVYGSTHESGFGFMLETHQWKSDGYQKIDRSNNDTGLDVEDYTLKLAYAPDDSRHAVEFKYQYAQQNSNQSYLGLTDLDFSNNAYRRYGLSDLDNIATEHNQFILRYEYSISEEARIAATAYENTHKRSWFKTEKFDIDTDVTTDFDSWFDIVQGINRGLTLGGLSSADLQAILDGGDTPDNTSIQLRDNNREYYSRGVQVKLDWDLSGNSVQHKLEMGIRHHEDEEDRLQQDFFYAQQNGSLVFLSANALGDAGNRVQQAKATSLYVHDTITFGDWVLTPGLRYEDIDLQRARYNDGAQRSFRDSRKNHVAVLLPGFGALYHVSEQLTILGGAHKGFSTPSNEPDVDEEASVNYELGARYKNGTLSAELVGFYNDYENILGTCTASSGSNCDPGDTSNGGKAMVRGVEFTMSNVYDIGRDISMPLSLVYSHTHSEFDSSFSDTAFFGTVTKGDVIPYIPENQLAISLGLEMDRWALNASMSYVDEVCTKPSCDAYEKTESSTTLDLIVSRQVNDDLGIYCRLENATSEENIVGRQPYGARPNKARTATVGMRLAF